MSIVRSFPVLSVLCLAACGAPPACPSQPCSPGVPDAGAPTDRDAAPIAERSEVARIEVPVLADAAVPCVPRDEVCDGADDDCDGAIDEGALTTFHRDADGDGFGHATFTLTACAPPPGFVLDGTDSDDDCPSCHPGAEEICDDLDQDCDGDAVTDALRTTYFVDADGDGFSPGLAGMARLCAPAPGYTDRVPSPGATDCADSDARAFPGQTAYATDPVIGVTGAIARWDFDCDGAAAGEHGIGGGCDTSIACTGRIGAFVGTTRPACGESATFQDSCRGVVEGTRYTCRSATSTRTQACR